MFLGNMFNTFNMFGMPGLFGGFNIWNMFGNSNQPDRTSDSSGCQCEHCGQDNTNKVKEEEDKAAEDSDIKETPKDNEVEKKRRLRDRRKLTIENDCPDKAVADEMEYIGRQVMKKYLKTGTYSETDLPIERVNAQITSVDFSGKYNLKTGTHNDYRNENGDIVRVADGTIVTIKYIYENQEYTCKIKSDKTPRKGEPQNFIDYKNLSLHIE